MQTFKQPLTADEENKYLELAKNGDINARNTLIEYNMRLVAHIIKKYQSPGRSVEDLLSIGTIGLIKAVNSYDKGKGNRLVTYASRCIENELLMRLRQEKKEAREVSIYEPIGTDKEGNEICLMDIISSGEESTLNSMIKGENLSALSRVFSNVLDDREQKILTLRYGLFSENTGGLTQQQLANIMGISRSYVSRIEKKALLKLRSALNE